MRTKRTPLVRYAGDVAPSGTNERNTTMRTPRVLDLGASILVLAGACSREEAATQSAGAPSAPGAAPQ